MLIRNCSKSLLAGAIVLVLAHVSTAQTQNTLITSESAGPVRLGMTSGDIFKLFPTSQIEWLDLGGDKRDMHLRIRDEKKTPVMDITIHFDEGGNLLATKLEVYGPAFKTEKDFSLGQTFGDLKQKHTINHTEINNGEASAISETDKLTFKIKISDRSLLDTSVVTSIAISRIPR